ncbi:MAG: metallophosphoesterase family protein [Gaiellaceae bacterium]
MRVAALYDVHAMPWALEAVLADVDADALVVGGDFVYGPCPRETVAIVRSLEASVLRGNCEREAPTNDWDRSHLSADDLAWISSLPLTAVVDEVLYCHATPTSDLPATTALTPEAEVRRSFAGARGTVVIGHTHHQFDRTVGDLRVVNAGSVGMPYEDDVAAFWTLVADGEPSFRRTPIDVERAIAGIRASGWPGGEELIAENLLVAPSRNDAIRQFEMSRRLDGGDEGAQVPASPAPERERR